MTIQNGCHCEIPGCPPGQCPNNPDRAGIEIILKVADTVSAEELMVGITDICEHLTRRHQELGGSGLVLEEVEVLVHKDDEPLLIDKDPKPIDLRRSNYQTRET